MRSWNSDGRWFSLGIHIDLKRHYAELHIGKQVFTHGGQYSQQGWRK